MKTLSRLISIAILLPLFLTSCDKMDEIDLSGSVFIEDSYQPGLPIYSEWGYNTFGAYIDRKAFVSTDHELPAKVFVNNDTLHLLLRGRMDNNIVDLKFSVKGFEPQNNFDLVMLDDTIINLSDSGRAVYLTINNKETKLDIIEGELIVKRAQRLFVDNVATRTIISGRFNLKTFINDEPAAISQGRYDLGIGYENFFNF